MKHLRIKPSYIYKTLKLLAISYFVVSINIATLSALEDKVEPEFNEGLVGIWSHDIKDSTKSIVMDFRNDGTFDAMVYDRFNIQYYDVAVGKYLVQDNKVYTLLFDAHGSKPYFKLNEIFESEFKASDSESLVLTNDKGSKEFKLISRRKVNLKDLI